MSDSKSEQFNEMLKTAESILSDRYIFWQPVVDFYDKDFNTRVVVYMVRTLLQSEFHVTFLFTVSDPATRYKKAMLFFIERVFENGRYWKMV